MLPGAALAVSYDPTLLNASAAGRLLAGVLATCLVASSNYVLNEILDAPTDRHHPQKLARPISSGRVRVPLAVAWWLVLAAAGLAIAAGISRWFLCAAAALWVMGLVYNVPPVRSKQWPYVDVLTESINNPIRLLLGWFALVDNLVPPISLALAYWMAGAFLMATKRYAEYRHIGDPSRAARYRRSFGHYTEERLLISMFFYAVSGAFFGGIFILRFHLELILVVPAVAGLFASYLKLGMLPDSPAQRPEALWRQRAIMAYLAVTTLLFLVLLFVRIPRLYDWLNVDPSAMPTLWTVGTEPPR